MPRVPGGIYTAAVLSAVLAVGAAPPSPLPLLTIVALAPLAAALASLTPDRAGRLRALRAGALHGAVQWGLLLLWVPRAGLRVGAWVVPGWIAMVGSLAILAALAAAAFHHLSTRARWPLWAAAGIAWGGVEWVRASGLGPMSFPWMGMALPLVGIPSLAQGAAVVGEIGLALMVAACGGWVAQALRAPRERGLRALVGVAAVVLLTSAAGAVRMAVVAPEPVARVLLVQPAVPLEVKRGDPAVALTASLEAVEAALPPPAPPVAPPVGGALVVLPETAVPTRLDGDGVGALRERVAGWALRMGAPIAVGAWAEGPGRGGNAVFVAGGDPEAEWPVSWKVRLVPGVEWTAGLPDGVARGTAPQVLAMGNGRQFAPLVCIEAAGASPARELVRSGAEILVNVTNDAWLAEAPWWTRTAAFHQHPAHLAMRAIELGVGGVRVGNNGRTETVDPIGVRSLVLPAHVPGQISVAVERLPDETLFTRGAVPFGPPVLFLSIVGLGLLGRRGAAPGRDEGVDRG
ncbi:MAG: apolipoprotein N-acyltransferase [Gemmatimonadetes bacterium]|nr:apolipoprotein N-acyltransferase [Gemmatimonadota bacterium]